VVSTNCPSGPAEILADSRYGKLVPVGDSHALARAMTDVLDDPMDAALLKGSAARYSATASAEHFERILGITRASDR
jgi:glycosyltransferase involved in cell wall biosynthesis